ncbi:MAG: hypothetical protein HYT98_04550 [Candidatus Sungbacteria bacterium]|nr:hypothetical protein [Candidatus Sungbacteria bacterium]
MSPKRFFLLPLFFFIVWFWMAGCSVTPKLYFGQPLAAYNSKTVERLLPVIQSNFPGWHIENPNQPKHDEGVKRWQAKTGNAMDYYFQEILPTMSGGIFLPFPDGAWSAGAYGEAVRLEELGMPLLKVTPNGAIEQTTTEKMRLWDGGVLSVRQTRERNKMPYDEWLRMHQNR